MPSSAAGGRDAAEWGRMRREWGYEGGWGARLTLASHVRCYLWTYGSESGDTMFDFTTLGTTEIALLAAAIVVLTAVIAVVGMQRKRRTARLQAQFGGAEYARTVNIDGNQRRAEAELEGRSQRVGEFHLRPLAAEDRLRYVESWRDIQGRFVDSPAGAVAEADHLLRDVMATRGYPLSDFEQRAADLSVRHPLGLENYRTAHDIAMRETQGKATTEELRQAMVYYRTLFEELASEARIPAAKAGG